MDKRYKTVKWKKLRQAVLMRDGYLCQESKRYGKTEAATTVHHVYPADEYPELFFNANNLISLSTRGHEAMHNRMTKEVTAVGKKWQERLKEKIFESPLNV